MYNSVARDILGNQLYKGDRVRYAGDVDNPLRTVTNTEFDGDNWTVDLAATPELEAECIQSTAVLLDLKATRKRLTGK